MRKKITRTKTAGKTKKLDSYYYKDLAPEKIKAADSRLMRTYGITSKDYDRMYKEQKETCWICKRPPVTIRFSVDHIHLAGYKSLPPEEKKKYVRGLLCFGCNTHLKGLEKTKDGKLNRQRLEGTYEYFKVFRLKGET